MSRPAFAELPDGRAWDYFGREDAYGTLNLIGPEQVLAATRLVRQGKVFALNTPIDVPGPAMFHRHSTSHQLISDDAAGGGVWMDDWLDSFWLQGSSQWDALRHFGDFGGVFYGGRSIDANADLGIDRMAERGVVARAVLADVGRLLDVDPFEPVAFGVEELEAALRGPLAQGDVLLVRTGWIERYRALPEGEQHALGGETPGSTGLKGDDVAAYLWDNGVAAIAFDNPAMDPLVPGEGGDHALHRALIPRLGMPVGELWELGPLAADCAQDGVYEMLFTSAPLFVRGGAGSPPNALVVK